MPVKYAPAHTNWVGAPTNGYTVNVLHVSRRPPWNRRGKAEACPISSQQPTRKGGREGHAERKRERDPTTMQHLTFSFSPHWTHILSLWNLSKTNTLKNNNYFTFCVGILNFVVIPEEMLWVIYKWLCLWFDHLGDMARGIESLVSLSPFCPMDSQQGGHSDNCKFWLLDLGRCLACWISRVYQGIWYGDGVNYRNWFNAHKQSKCCLEMIKKWLNTVLNRNVGTVIVQEILVHCFFGSRATAVIGWIHLCDEILNQLKWHKSMIICLCLSLCWVRLVNRK